MLRTHRAWEPRSHLRRERPSVEVRIALHDETREPTVAERCSRLPLAARRERRVYFAKLDPETADLNLAVEAPQEREAPVAARQKRNAITRAIKSTRSEGVVDEARACRFIVRDVPNRDPRPADIEFTCHAIRNGLPAAIENVDLSTGERSPDWRCSNVLGTDFMRRGGNRRFGRTVSIDQPRARDAAGAPKPNSLRGQNLTATN